MRLALTSSFVILREGHKVSMTFGRDGSTTSRAGQPDLTLPF